VYKLLKKWPYAMPMIEMIMMGYGETKKKERLHRLHKRFTNKKKLEGMVVLLPNYSRVAVHMHEGRVLHGVFTQYTDVLSEQNAVVSFGIDTLTVSVHRLQVVPTPSEVVLEAIEEKSTAFVDIDALDGDGNAAIHLALTCCRPHRTLTGLLKSGAKVDQPNNLGRTPLHIACTRNNATATRLLLSMGVEQIPDVIGDFPLHDACRSGSCACAMALVSAGADIEAENRLCETPLMVAAGCQLGSPMMVVQYLCLRGARRDIAETRCSANSQIYDWFCLTRECSSELHHFLTDLQFTQRSFQLLRDGAALDSKRSFATAPTVLDSARAILKLDPRHIPHRVFTSSRMIVAASKPWTLSNAHLWPLQARRTAATAMALLRVLERDYPLRDIWVSLVMPLAIGDRSFWEF